MWLLDHKISQNDKTHVKSGIDDARHNMLMSRDYSTRKRRRRLRFQEYARQLPTFDQYTFLQPFLWNSQEDLGLGSSFSLRLPSDETELTECLKDEGHDLLIGARPSKLDNLFPLCRLVLIEIEINDLGDYL